MKSFLVAYPFLIYSCANIFGILILMEQQSPWQIDVQSGPKIAELIKRLKFLTSSQNLSSTTVFIINLIINVNHKD